MKMKKLALAIAGLGLCALIVGPAQAASAKTSVDVSGVALVESTNQTNSWDKVLSATIHVANAKELIAGASLETGLYTRTLVKSKGGTKDTATATAQIEVSVWIDYDNDGVDPDTGERTFDAQAAPGDVVFDKRTQTLSAVLGGVIESCSDSNGDGTIIIATECVVTDEEIELILDTMGAHHFNFVLGNLPQGTHYLELQAQITSSTGAMVGESEASALIGKGSFTVEEVRAVKTKDEAGSFNFSM